MVFALFLFLGAVVTLIYGLCLYLVGSNFKRKAIEVRAVVKDGEVKEEVRSVDFDDDFGGFRTQEVVKRTYYVTFITSIPNLPPEITLIVSEPEYLDMEIGDEVMLYYLPNDLNRMALAKDAYATDAFWVFFAGFVLLTAGAVALVVEII